MRLNRSALLHFIDATPAGTTRKWFKVGKDVEDMSIDLNADIQTVKNILDETSVTHMGYEPSVGVDTYYADPDDDFYDFVLDIALGRKKGDSCKTKVLEVVVENTTATSHLAYQEDVIVEVTSYGGPQGGISIPYTVHFAGNRTKGTVAFTAGVPTFTADSTQTGG